MVDVDRYLERIGYGGPRRPDLATLHMIHRAHLACVPHENIDVHLDEPLRLDSEWILGKVVNRRRGGSCFELNGALQLLLAELGFSVQMIETAPGRERVGDAAWGNHLSLLVEVDGDQWLADVGIGVGWCWPLRLREGAHRQGPLVYRIERLDPETWRVHRRPGCAPTSTDLRLAPRRVTDYLDVHRWYATSADSLFSRLLVVQQPRDDHVLMLRGLVLTRRGPGVDGEVSQRIVSTREEFTRLLVDEFGVELDDFGADGLSRLWERANEQHLVWLAEKASRGESTVEVEPPFTM